MSGFDPKEWSELWEEITICDSEINIRKKVLEFVSAEKDKAFRWRLLTRHDVYSRYEKRIEEGLEQFEKEMEELKKRRDEMKGFLK